jgi:ArsR family transcriptional regulator, arsenate/arsenite/antimonite-responsive transcriptional repressor
MPAYAQMRMTWSAPMIVVVLSALAEPNRFETMHLLADGSEHCACELAQKLRATQSRISRHKQVLKHVGLVADRPDAQMARDRMSPDLSPMARLVQVALDRDLAVREALV